MCAATLSRLGPLCACSGLALASGSPTCTNVSRPACRTTCHSPPSLALISSVSFESPRLRDSIWIDAGVLPRDLTQIGDNGEVSPPHDQWDVCLCATLGNRKCCFWALVCLGRARSITTMPLLNQRSNVITLPLPQVAHICPKSGPDWPSSARVRSTSAESRPIPGQTRPKIRRDGQMSPIPGQLWPALVDVASILGEVSPNSADAGQQLAEFDRGYPNVVRFGPSRGPGGDAFLARWPHPNRSLWHACRAISLVSLVFIERRARAPCSWFLPWALWAACLIRPCWGYGGPRGGPFC